MIEVDNTVRAAWAKKAIVAFQRECAAPDENVETMMGDLLADIAHLARLMGLDPREKFEEALGCFDDEEREEAVNG
jgi:NTP pyrophosphatase (non-canonical NTP hydrolase)